MNDFKISPRFFNPLSLIYGFLAIIVTSVMGIVVFPRWYNLYKEFPNDPAVLQILIPLIFVLISIWLIFFFGTMISIGKMIEVKGKLVYFKKRAFLGLGKWTIEKLIDFSKVAWVKDRKKTGYISTGKSLVPYILYWIIFEMTDGSKQEILLNGWDGGSLKNLFYYLRGRFPDIKFDNVILQDSPEKLSGIDEYLSKTTSKSG